MPNPPQPPTPAPAPKPPAPKKPAPKKPAPKKAAPPKKRVIPPPPGNGGAGPMHKHTGFIIAIVVTAVLLVIAAILAIISWSQGQGLRSHLNQREADIGILLDQSAELQEQFDEALQLADAAHYYVIENEDPFEAPSKLYAENPVTGERTLIFETDRLLRIIAQPRRGAVNTILVDQLTEGDNPSYSPFLFDVIDGEELTPAPVFDVLPFGRSAVFLSPDEQYFAALYDSAGTLERELAFLDVVTGEKHSVLRLTEGEFFAERYTEFAGLGTVHARWVDHDCVQVWIYTAQHNDDGIETSRALTKTPTYCLSDHM